MKKIVNMPIEVPMGKYCWDGKCICEYFSNEGGHAHCELGFFNIENKKNIPHVLKPFECVTLEEA